MTKLPRVSGRECLTALAKVGFVVLRQRGSHIVMRRTDPHAQVIVSNHREIDRGTLRTIIRDADMTIEEFVNLL